VKVKEVKVKGSESEVKSNEAMGNDKVGSNEVVTKVICQPRTRNQDTVTVIVRTNIIWPVTSYSRHPVIHTHQLH
jgi:hypothetical protein